MIERDVLQMA